MFIAVEKCQGFKTHLSPSYFILTLSILYQRISLYSLALRQI